MSVMAYIDPGSGALIWQIAVAAVMGFLFYLSKVRAFLWRGITAIFRLGKKKDDASDSDGAKKV